MEFLQTNLLGNTTFSHDEQQQQQQNATNAAVSIKKKQQQQKKQQRRDEKEKLKSERKQVHALKKLNKIQEEQRQAVEKKKNKPLKSQANDNPSPPVSSYLCSKKRKRHNTSNTSQHHQEDPPLQQRRQRQRVAQQQQHYAVTNNNNRNTFLPRKKVPTATLNNIEFTLLGPETLERLSVVEVTNTQMYRKRVAEKNSLNDSKMGTSDSFVKCSSCLSTMENCPGHLGMMRCSVPIFNIEMLNHILKILRSTCYNCCRCLVKPNHPQYEALKQIVNCKKRILAISKIAQNIKICGRQTHGGNKKQQQKKEQSPLPLVVAEQQHTVGRREELEEADEYPDEELEQQQYEKEEEEEEEEEEKEAGYEEGEDDDDEEDEEEEDENDEEEEDEEDNEETVQDEQIEEEEPEWKRSGCCARQPLYIKDGIFIKALFDITGNDETDDQLPPHFNSHYIRKTLELIPPEDLKFMGYHEPQNSLFTLFPIPPQPVRPAIAQTSGSHILGQDDLSKKLKTIVKLNNSIHKRLVQEREEVAAVKEKKTEKQKKQQCIKKKKRDDADDSDDDGGSSSSGSGSGSSSSEDDDGDDAVLQQRRIKENQKSVCGGDDSEDEEEKASILKKTLSVNDWNHSDFSLALYRFGEFRHENLKVVREYAKQYLKQHPEHSYFDVQHMKMQQQQLPKEKISNHSLKYLYIQLQLAIATYQNSEAGSGYNNLNRMHGAKIKGIRQKIVGKEGRIRTDATGKRGGNCGRTVLSGNTDIGIGEILAPRFMCQQLSRKETVRDDNIIHFTRLFRKGLINYIWVPRVDNASELELLDFTKEKFDFRSTHRLQLGQVVEVPLRDGDKIPANRQPSLHKYSIMAHQIKINKNPTIDTLGFHTSCTTPYNMDYDGDEGTMFNEEDYRARAEVDILMPIRRHIVSGASNKPNISFVQNGILGQYKLTRPDWLLSKTEALKMIMEAKVNCWQLPPPTFFSLKNNHHNNNNGNKQGWKLCDQSWSGSRIYSLLLPPQFNLCMKQDAEYWNHMNFPQQTYSVTLASTAEEEEEELVSEKKIKNFWGEEQKKKTAVRLEFPPQVAFTFVELEYEELDDALDFYLVYEDRQILQKLPDQKVLQQHSKIRYQSINLETVIRQYGLEYNASSFSWYVYRRRRHHRGSAKTHQQNENENEDDAVMKKIKLRYTAKIELGAFDETNHNVYNKLRNFNISLHAILSKTKGLCIQNGELLVGRIRKEFIGSVSCGIIHYLYLEYSPSRCERFINEAQTFANVTLRIKPSTITLRDCINPCPEKTQNLIALALTGAERLETDYYTTAGQNNERLISILLDLSREFSSEAILDELNATSHLATGLNNNMFEIGDSGSKGSAVNIQQIQGFLGQQILKGGRMPILSQHLKSTAQQKGYVTSSFYTGLNDMEHFLHSKAGREGLVDTSVKTAETGYLQSRLCKGMKNNIVQSDFTVRNTNDVICSFRYGDDNFDSTHLRPVTLDCLQKNDDQLKRKYSTHPDDW